MSGTLYLVATPIGNLEDISARALRVLREADLILAEDTRVSGKLLARFEVKTPMAAHQAHTRPDKLHSFIGQLKAGESLALVTDAGTPGIQDPGGLLVEMAHEADIPVIPIPGPSALTAALSGAGFPADTFTFIGFLPTKKGRQTALRALPEAGTIVIYETAPRLPKLLRELSERFTAARQAWVGRELTKLHEETKRGTIGELREHFDRASLKGEIVVVVGPK